MAFDKSKFFEVVNAPHATRVVEVPGFGATTVRALTGEEYDRFEEASTVEVGGKRTYRTDRALLARLSVVDPDAGAQVFGDDDLPRLKGLPARTLIPVAKAALALCGLGEDAAGN